MNDPVAVDLDTSIIHLGLGATCVAVPDFLWRSDDLVRYGARFARDGDEGRMVSVGAAETDWTTWERHPFGEELVLVMSGRVRLIQDVDGERPVSDLGPRQAVINPKGVWHTLDVLEPGHVLSITAGRGTEHRPRERTGNAR